MRLSELIGADFMRCLIIKFNEIFRAYRGLLYAKVPPKSGLNKGMWLHLTMWALAISVYSMVPHFCIDHMLRSRTYQDNSDVSVYTILFISCLRSDC